MPLAGESLSSSSLLVMAILATAISLASVLAALDARDRGLSRGACVLWFLGIQFFFPIIFIYLFVRNTAPAARKVNRITFDIKKVASDKKPECPYCGKPHDEGARLCSGCGRFL